MSVVESLLVQEYQSLRVVIVDHSPAKEISLQLRRRYPQIVVLQGPQTLWWAGAVELGIRYVCARAKPGDFLLSLNNDVQCPADLVSNLVKAGRPRAIVACACFSSLNTELNIGGIFDWRAGTREYVQGATCRDTPESLDLDFLISRGILYPVECFSVAGTFNVKDLPHYHAEMEFTYRAKRKGFRLIVEPKALLTVHETRETSGEHICFEDYMSFSQAWRVLTSTRSCYQLKQMFRFFDLCAPPQYRARNKWRFFLASLSHSYGRTRPGVQLKKIVSSIGIAGLRS